MASKKHGSMMMIMQIVATLVPMLPFRKKKQRNAYQHPAAKADELSFREIEHDLGLYRVQILGYRNISHYLHLLNAC
jgi:hypothetical protein